MTTPAVIHVPPHYGLTVAGERRVALPAPWQAQGVDWSKEGPDSERLLDVLILVLASHIDFGLTATGIARLYEERVASAQLMLDFPRAPLPQLGGDETTDDDEVAYYALERRLATLLGVFTQMVKHHAAVLAHGLERGLIEIIRPEAAGKTVRQ